MNFAICAEKQLTRVIVACAVLLLSLATAPLANAAIHSVGTSVSSVDCRTFEGGVRPGDKIVLSGKSRGTIKFLNCYGTDQDPITITNDTTQSGPLLITKNGDGFSSECISCEHVVIDGTGKWAGAPPGQCGATISSSGEWALGTTQCGIIFRCGSGQPQSTLRLGGSSKNVTVKGVEIDGNVPACTRGIGLHVNDHQYTATSANEWREGILLKNIYIHDTGRSGVYFGPNQAKGGVGDLQLRNNEIANIYVNRVGCDGIKYKSAIAGSSSIHHNYVTNTGQSNGDNEDGCGANGIALFESGYTDVYSNYVESPAPVSTGPGNCIAQSTSNLTASQVGSLPIRIFNNVVHNCKGKGIASTRSNADSPELIPNIYNNTIVGPVGGNGVSVTSNVKSCTIRANIVSGVKIATGQCVVSQNIAAAIDAQGFVDARDNDFRLTANSPAIDDGGAQCPPVDQAGNERPQGGACDAGAFEYLSGQTAQASKPNPPGSLAVE